MPVRFARVAQGFNGLVALVVAAARARINFVDVAETAPHSGRDLCNRASQEDQAQRSVRHSIAQARGDLGTT